MTTVPYERVKLEITTFDKEDVIATSTNIQSQSPYEMPIFFNTNAPTVFPNGL